MKTEDVIAAYEKYESIKETARRIRVSESVVRKCLVSHGIINTPLTRKIAELQSQGLAQAEIAKAIGVSRAYVNANTPYVRGMMIVLSQTVNAQRIRKCREKRAKSK